LGTARIPFYIEVGVFRVVVRHTCARRLRIRGKCNCRGEIRDNVGERHYSSFELVFVAPSTPLVGKGCVMSNNARCFIWAIIVFGLSNWGFRVLNGPK